MSAPFPPLFSVIIPTFNRKDFLPKCLQSVLDQTMTDFEIIVIDDGSVDGTGEMISGYSDGRIIYRQQENQGVAAARNRALGIARGEWIAFLDSDDWWETSKLARFASEIRKFPEIKIFHSQEVWYRQGKILNQKKIHQKPDGLVYFKALPLCCISISTAVVARRVFEKIGDFDEEFPVCEDYDFWLRATHEFQVKLIDEPLTRKDGGREDQLTSGAAGLDRYRIKALEKMLLSRRLSADEFDRTFNELKVKAGVYAKGAKKRGRDAEAGVFAELIKGLSLTRELQFAQS